MCTANSHNLMNKNTWVGQPMTSCSVTMWRLVTWCGLLPMRCKPRSTKVNHRTSVLNDHDETWKLYARQACWYVDQYLLYPV